MATSTSTSSSKPSRSPTKPSSQLAMAELKSRILSALSKLSDRDTHQIAADELTLIIRTLPPDAVPMLLSSVLHDPPSPPGKQPPLPARRESLRLLSLLCSSHTNSTAAHLPKIISFIVRRLKDPASDSSVRDACRDAFGSISGIYMHTASDEVAASNLANNLFVKPLLEVMGEQNKAVQAGAAMCLARVVECACGGGEVEGRAVVSGMAFQKLGPRICKLLGSQSCLAKGVLLSVLSSLSQVGAISSQGMQPLLQSIRECLDSSDWATRKAAADTLSVLASHSSHLLADGVAPTIAALEACRFDKVKPVRDSMMEALLLWKQFNKMGENGTSEYPKDGKNGEATDPEEKSDQKRSNMGNRISEPMKGSSSGSSPTGGTATTDGKGRNIPEKAAVMLKKKVPPLTDKELNPEFFQKLETRSTNDLPVEVVVPRRCLQSSHSQGDEPELIDSDSRVTSDQNDASGHESNENNASSSSNYHGSDKSLGAHRLQNLEDSARDRWVEQRGIRAKDLKSRAFDTNERNEIGQKDQSSARVNISRADGHVDSSFINNKGNWPAIQRQLSQLERQQANIMNMLQHFMGGSHDSMVTLENRVRGLERIIEEMARDLALSTGRRGSNMMMGYDGSPGRSSSKYNGLNEYSGAKFGKDGDSRIPFAERYYSSENLTLGGRGRDPPWRSDYEAWDSYAYGGPRNGLLSSKRGSGTVSLDGRIQRMEHHSDQVGTRRAWDKGQGLLWSGEGPSARSVWQASKDEATLEAIRVAGEDNVTSRSATRGTIPELDAEAMLDDNPGQDRGPLWASWTSAMDSLHIGDLDSAYAELLATGDDLLLVKLMDRSGPVMDQLSTELACEVMRAIAQFLLEQSLLDIALTWTQQLTDLVAENGSDFLGISLEGKKEILLNLHEASALEPPEDWEGPHSDQLMVQLADAWGINIQHLIK